MAKTIKSSDDKVLYYYYKATEYFQENRQKVYTALSIIAAIIVLLFFYMMRQKSNNENAMVELSKAQDIYNSGNYQQAINGDSLNISKGLIYIVNEYGSTKSGESAKVMLANSYYYLRDFDNAEKWYKEYSGSNKIYKSASIAGIAAVYEAKNNFVEAAKEFEKAADVDKNIVTNDENIYYAARNYSKANDAANFKRLYDKLKIDYPKSTYIQQLERYKI